ncbi:hypothetical protein [Halopiger goleimassiliensis]|uniref:hypothetical protein n=1 Tax=Halopiger goleimassiliensis TaxID=1293048 RepID=UPI000677F497|nr:hypothetical protein [Halopiger goleimassiliensis]
MSGPTEFEQLDAELRESRVYAVKTHLDKLLPVALLLIPVLLYLEFLTASDHPLYPYKPYLNAGLLAYFVVELAASFALYEDRKAFVSDRWLDVLLTLPFFTFFKGVNHLVHSLTGLKTFKLLKTGKIAKTLKLTKLWQKLGKLYTKGTKRVKRWLE